MVGQLKLAVAQSLQSPGHAQSRQLKSLGRYEAVWVLSIIFPHKLVGFETDTSKHTSSEAFLEVSVRYHFPAQAHGI